MKSQYLCTGCNSEPCDCKPREFWIVGLNVIDGTSIAHPVDPDIPNASIHVIEYSAVECLERERKTLVELREELIKERDKYKQSAIEAFKRNWPQERLDELEHYLALKAQADKLAEELQWMLRITRVDCESVKKAKKILSEWNEFKVSK